MSNEDDRADVALTSSEQELRLVVETIPALVWKAGPDGNFEYVNKRVLEYVGAPLAEIIGWGWMEKIHPDDIAFKVSNWLESLDSGNPHDAVCRIRRADGQYRWFEVRGEPLRASDGTVLSWYGVLIDVDERRKAEGALRESEYNLRQIIDTVPGLIWSTGPDGEPTHVSQRLLDYSGMRFEDFKHVGWKAFVHPDDFPETAKAYYHAIQSGTSYRGVLRLRRADGEFHWHQTRCEPLHDRQERIIHWYGLTVDIDEGKKAEDRLRRSEAYLAEAQRLSHSGSWAMNAATRAITYWSEETYHIWGFDPMRGLPDRDSLWLRIHREDRGRVFEEVQEALRQQRDYEVGFRIVLPDGTARYLKAIGHHLLSAHGELVEVVGTAVDVTEHKRAESALRESEEKFRDYAETASDWFWEIGPDYKFTRLTENAFGSDPAVRIGTACWDHALDLETEPEKWRLIRATLDSRKPFRDFVYCSVGGNGSPMYVKGSGKPVFDANGEFRGYRGTGSDVTATMRAQEEHERLRQLESELAHMNRLDMMGHQAASLAHEITQPISAARNYARAALNFLERQPPDLGEVKKQLGSVVAAADRSGELVERIREHIRKAPPQKAHFDLNHAINEVIALGRTAITRNEVSVQVYLAAGLAPVQGDRVQLQQVVLNLILNAVEAMGSVEAEPRELSISTEQNQAKGVLVAVRDSGPGVDPEDIERVFEAFYTTKTSGMGMGLSICRSIIDAHGGRLWAGVNEPRGAVFQFTLPAADKEIMDPGPAALHTRVQHEDSASDAHHPLAYEDNRRPRRSGHVPDQLHWGEQ
jgi:hypothetical protein